MPRRPAWSVAEPHAPTVLKLSKELGLSEITAACLANRGFSDVHQVRCFLDPKLNELEIPSGMADLEKAANRVAEAVMEGQQIGVFGDYDVDGLSSAALVVKFLSALGSLPRAAVADRFSSGYGLVPAVVREMKEAGCQVLVALDCGTSDHEAMDEAAKLGVHVIIVDHHRIDKRHPDAFAFVNPHRQDCHFADKNLAAVGLSFYFCAAIRSKLVKEGFVDRDSVDPRDLLDLVALGTIADVVPLLGNNRILTSAGLKLMSSRRRPGIAALLTRARTRSRNIRADHVSYQIAPRLNAAGRLASAHKSLELLICDDPEQATILAGVLEQYTVERRAVEEAVTTEAREQAVIEMANGTPPVLVLSGNGWHKGVIGIVAARLSEEFSVPTFIVGFDGEEGTGSSRGQGQLSLYGALKAVGEHLVRYGGHRDAAGFTVNRPLFETAKNGLIEFARHKIVSLKVNELVCDARVRPSQLNAALLFELERVGPFGNANPEPIFEISQLDVLRSRVVGSTHLKLELKTPSGSISAFGPRLGYLADKMAPLVDVAASLSVDEWKGDGSPELRLACPPEPSE